MHEYLEAARGLGVRVLIASEGEHALMPEVAGGLHVPLGDPDAALPRVLSAARAAHVAAVVATDDVTVELASRVAEGLGLAHNPVHAARVARRKDLARTALREAGLPVPEFRCVDLRGPALGAALRGLRYPCVVKPLAMSASRGVIRADDEPALRAAIERVRAIVAGAPREEERRTLLVERFVPGTEVALEGMLRGGELQVLALFDKPDPLNGPYFEETYYVTPSRLDEALQRRVARRVAQACTAYGLREGPVHAEARVHRGEAWVLEVAARTIGGECARLLRFGTGTSLEELVIRNALGASSADSGHVRGAAGVLMLPVPAAGVLRRVEGVLAAERVPLVEEVRLSVREGYELVPLPEGGDYLGFVFARGDDPGEVEAALREAHARLRIVVAPHWKLVPANSADRGAAR